MNKLIVTKRYMVLLFLGAAMAACGGSDDGEGDNNNAGHIPDNAQASIIISGQWTIEETDTGNNCGEGDLSDTWFATITQTGSEVTLNDGSATYQGAVDGTTLYWVTTFPEDGGTTTSNGQVTQTSTTEMTGTASWVWKGNGEQCSGTTDITATCTSPAPCITGS